MKKSGSLFVLVLLAACGSHQAKKSTAPAPAAAPAHAAVTPMPAGTEAVYESPPEKTPPPKTGVPKTPPAPEEAPATEPEKPMKAQTVAVAELKSIKDGTDMGKFEFTQEDDGTITISGDVTGLKKNGVNAVYVHENGDCSSKGKKIGAHLNPTHAKHGPPSSSQRHAGDFGNLTADESGGATFSMTTDSVTLEADRPDSILGRALVIHAKKDDKKGNAGAVLACGVIEIAPAE